MDNNKVKILIDQCASGDPSFQVGAILELSDNKIYGSVPTLIKLTSSPNGNVRGAAAEALGYLGGPKIENVGPVFLRLLDDQDDLVRDDAVKSLGMLAYPPARISVEHLLLTDAEWLVRASAAEALGYLRDELSFDPLKVALTKDDVGVVRGWAAFSLGLLENKGGLALLASQLKTEEDDTVRVDILFASYRLGSQSDLKTLLALSTTSDKVVTYNIVNRFENLLKFKRPPTLAEDAGDIQRSLNGIAERFPILQSQVDEIINKLSIIKPRKD
jgi:HEAT repeat protein